MKLAPISQTGSELSKLDRISETGVIICNCICGCSRGKPLRLNRGSPVFPALGGSRAFEPVRLEPAHGLNELVVAVAVAVAVAV